MGYYRFGRLQWCLASVLLLSLLVGNAAAQSLPSFAGKPPFPFPSQLSRPSNPLGAPGSAYGPVGSDVVPLSSGMLRGLLPRIPNLEVGFLYNIGNNVRSGRFYADYLYPLSLSANSVIFGEAHYESQDFWKKPDGGSEYRQDVSLGGGFRRVFGESAFFGVNAFYDSTKLFGTWYSSSGVGLEMVALTPGDAAIDLNFNWYGNLINRSQLINAFRNLAGSWDIEAGVSQPLFGEALDLRLKAAAYDFNIGTAVYGWRAGADLTTRDGVFTFKYEHGQDRINGNYDTIGGYVNVGLQLENIVRGESPFVMPEPVFASPRNLWRLLTQKVHRNWHQPAAVVIARGSGGGSLCTSVTNLVYSDKGPSYRVVSGTFGGVSYTDLVAGKLIRVTFSYEFVNAPTSDPGNSVEIFVESSSGWNQYYASGTLPRQGQISVLLDYDGWPAVGQDAFIALGENPTDVTLVFSQEDCAGVTLTGVTVCFNQ